MAFSQILLFEVGTLFDHVGREIMRNLEESMLDQNGCSVVADIDIFHQKEIYKRYTCKTTSSGFILNIVFVLLLCDVSGSLLDMISVMSGIFQGFSIMSRSLSNGT